MTKTPKRKTSGLTHLVVNQVKAPPSGRIELWDTRGLHLRVSEKKKIWLLRYRFEGKQRRLEV